MMTLGLITPELRHALALLLYAVGLIALVVILRHNLRALRKKPRRDGAQENRMVASGKLLVRSIELRERFLKQRGSLLIPKDGSLDDQEVSAILSRLRKLQPRTKQ